MANGIVQRPGPVIAALGGLVAVVAAFLSWSTGGFVATGVSGVTTSEKSSSTSGISGTGGKLALAVGVIVIAAAVGRAVFRNATPRLLAGVVIVVGAAALLFIGITEALDISGQQGFTLTGTTAAGEHIRIGSETSVGIGVWLTIVAGVAAAIGGLLAFWRAAPAEPEKVMGEGGAGL